VQSIITAKISQWPVIDIATLGCLPAKVLSMQLYMGDTPTPIIPTMLMLGIGAFGGTIALTAGDEEGPPLLPFLVNPAGNRPMLCVHPTQPANPLMTQDTIDMHTQDYIGNKVTPLLPVGEAYYRQKMPTYIFGMHDHVRQQHIAYMYNPRIGHKGPNNIISAEYHCYRAHSTGSKYHISHFDRCGGQSNNINCIKFHLAICSKDYGMQLFLTSDRRAAFTGHSFSDVDRAGGHLARRYQIEGKPEMATHDDWYQMACSANRSRPWMVYKFQQSAHRRWLKTSGMAKDTNAGFLDPFFRKSPPAGGWDGLRDGKKVKVSMSEFRWIQMGGGVDDDGVFKWHPGVLWMRKQLTEFNFQGKDPWTKVDIRKYKNGKPVTLADIDVKLRDVMASHFDLYDGNPIPQKAKKDHGVHMLARHAGCKCNPDGLHNGMCQPQRATPKRTCLTLCDQWLYPPLPDPKVADALEHAFQESEGVFNDTESDGDEMTVKEVREEVEEDEAPVSKTRSFNPHTRADAANAASKRAKAMAEPLAGVVTS
jgi:hypothetical protein